MNEELIGQMLPKGIKLDDVIDVDVKIHNGIKFLDKEGKDIFWDL